MVFSSVLFLFYFLPVFLLIYYLIPGNQYKNYFLLASSIFFYAWGVSSFILIALASIVVDFYLVNLSQKKNQHQKKRILVLCVGLNIALLFYFKYVNFFIDNVNQLVQALHLNKIEWIKIALPAGISFFVFKKISYVVDVYRGSHPPMKSITNYSLFILLFPELIAGPIVRFNEIAGQIEDRKYNETVDNRLLGFFRFVIGLSKKVLIANVLGKQVDEIFAIAPGNLGTATAWIGIIGYSMQIYFDFSGYSDMAIGLAKMIGFKFPENFDNPYISKSITEFWRRWHITLGRWMKDYLYIPLGGNRVSVSRLYFNLLFVFFLSGLWHGASWNFVIWGIYHGIFLIADRLFLLRLLDKVGVFFSTLFTYLVVIIGWVFFRSETLHGSIAFLKAMFGFNHIHDSFFLNNSTLISLLIAIFFSFITLPRFGKKIQESVFADTYSFGMTVFMFLSSMVLFFFCTSFVMSSGFNPFIYYRF